MGTLLAACLFLGCAPPAPGTDASPAKSPQKEPIYKGRPLSAWVKDLQDPVVTVRLKAAQALCRMGPEKYPAVPAILRAINDEKNDGVRCWAGSALNRLDQRAVPALCKGLEGSGMISLLITDVLEGMGPKAKRSVPCLLKVFKGGGSEELREAVGFALWQIDPEAAAKNGAKKPQTDP